MFWSKKNKTDKQAGHDGKHNKNSRDDELNVGNSESQRIREEALANARAARETIGQETLQRIAQAMSRMENSATAKAQAQIQKTDSDRVAAEIMLMMDD